MKKPNANIMFHVKTLIGVIVGFFIILGICAMAGTHIEKQSGKSSSDNVIVAYLRSLETRNKKDLSRLIAPNDPNSYNITSQLTAYAKKMSTIDSIDYDNMQVTLLDVDMAENIHEKMPKMQLQDSQLSYVEVPMTHTVDGSHYDTLATYFIVTYRTNDKWYLYDVNQDLIYVNFGTDPDGNPVDPYEAMGLFNSSFIGGDKDIGYIPLDSTWTAYDPGVSEFISEIGEVVSQQHYMQDTENAAIHMLRLRTDTTAEELAAHLWENLSHTDGITEENETVTIANCNAFCTKYFNETLGIYFISYILEAPDGDIRYLSIEATEDYLSAYLYLLALVLPQNNT